MDSANRIVPDDEEGKTIEIDQFAMGNLAGFQMALDDLHANGFKGFTMHEKVWIKCVEIQPAMDSSRSPMPMFELVIE